MNPTNKLRAVNRTDNLGKYVKINIIKSILICTVKIYESIMGVLTNDSATCIIDNEYDKMEKRITKQ